MKRYLLLPAALLLFAHTLFSQPETPRSSSEILQDLKKLNVTGSVLYIAAHPDDENTRLLGYLANEKKFRTAYLSLTRGDGGQNLIGKEQGELLGLIRTQELLAARRVDGAEQFFTRANDFGYSKNPEETLEFWNKDSTLYDVVLAIRKLKPDIIICRFPTTGEGGHGHHTASAILALEAFDAAADRKRFSDQLKFTEVWQAKRIYWNTYNFGSNNTIRPGQLKIDVGAYNPLLGKSYGEISAESRSMHKSQGFGSAKQRGSNFEYFKYLKGDSAKTELFENLNLGWTRIKGGDKVEIFINHCINNFSAEAPEKSIPGLILVHKAILELEEKNAEIKYWKKLKLAETEKLITNCAGIWIEANATNYTVVPGEALNYTVEILNRSTALTTVSKITFANGQDSSTAFSLVQNGLRVIKRNEVVSDKLPYSSPYWLLNQHSTGRYAVTDKHLIGQAENSPPFKVYIDLVVSGMPLKIERPICFKSTDPVKGEIYRPLEILPPITINFADKILTYTDTSAKKFNVSVNGSNSDSPLRLTAKAPKGWKIHIASAGADEADQTKNNSFDVTIKPEGNAENGVVSFAVELYGKTFNKSIQRINYDHIPAQFNLVNAEIKLIKMDLKKSGSQIAYILGAGDDVPACLTQIGYSVTLLSVDQLKKSDLSRYDAIVTGIRAYNVNEELASQREKLLEFVKKGGNLIVQYNTNSRVGPIQSTIGPLPFTISRERVTNENAPVVFTNEKHPALNFPNKITQKDFDDWIQERGIYFAKDYNNSYETILSMADAKEEAQEGSVIICKYGEGNFVYTGLAFFRELPAGVPGAYRLFANLISLPKNQSDKK